MDFKQLEAFVQVAKHKSFSGAADAMFSTQPTLSAQVRALEKEIGVRLLHRSREGVRPTKQGEIFLKYALDLVNTREQAICDIYHYSKNIGGVLEIQTSSVPGEYLLPKILADFSKRYPKVKFDLKQSDSSIVEQNLIENKGEVGFVGNKTSSKLEYYPFAQDEIVLITPNEDRFRKIQGNKITLNEVKDEYFILREQGSGNRKDLKKQLLGEVKENLHLQIIATMNSLGAIKQAVSEGMGVAAISRIAAEDQIAESPYLVFSLPDLHSVRTFYLACGKNKVLSPTAQIFKNFVLGTFESESL